MPGQIQISVNTKQCSIIMALLDSGSHITLQEISEKTHLSIRTVRYNMEAVRVWFLNENITLSSRSGYGYELSATNAEKKKLRTLFFTNSQHMINLSKMQRQRMAIFELLLKNEPVSYQWLAEKEETSRSTFVKDLVDIKTWLAKFDLTLNRTQNRGTFISGSELSRRYAFVLLIREELGVEGYLSLWKYPKLDGIFSKGIFGSLENFLKELHLSQCHDYVELIEKIMGYKLALDSRIVLMLYLSVMIYLQSHTGGATKLRRQYTYEIKKIDTKEGFEAELSVFLIKEISRRISLRYAKEEISFLTIILLISRWEITENNYLGDEEAGSDQIFHLDEESITCSDLIVSACSRQLHPLLQMDGDLRLNLARHFQSVIQIIKLGLPVINDNVKMTISQYPEIYRSINAEIGVLEDFIGHKVPIEEITTIVLYMVSALDKIQTDNAAKISVNIIGDGLRSSALFLQNRLQLLFPTLKVTKIINGVPENRDIAVDAALVISLIPAALIPFPVIEISPFLLPEEIGIIQNWILEFEKKNRKSLVVPLKKPDLVDLLKPENVIICDEKINDWKSVVQIACQPLLNGHLIKESYYDSIIQITEQFGPYSNISPGVVLLHGLPTDGVIQPCISMLLLKEKVPFSSSVNIDIAFVIGTQDNYSHLNALYQLSKIFGNQGFLTSIRSCTTVAEVLRTVWIFSLEYQLSETDYQLN